NVLLEGAGFVHHENVLARQDVFRRKMIGNFNRHSRCRSSLLMMNRTDEQIRTPSSAERKAFGMATTFSHLSETYVSARISTVPEPLMRLVGRLPGFIGLVPPPALDKSAFVFGSCHD